MIGRPPLADPFEPTTDDSAVPIPPRYWWLKRIVAACAVFVAALVGIRIWWGHVADARFQAQIDEYRAAGQPIYPEDFDSDFVEEKDNAAAALQEAVAALDIASDSADIIAKVVADPAANAEHSKAIDGILDANRDTLAWVREARRRPGVDWGVRIRRPVILAILPSLSVHRQVAKLLYVAALRKHQTGHHAEALETIQDTLDYGATVAGGSASLITYLVAISIDALAVNATEQIVPTLSVGDGATATRRQGHPAGREQVKALVTELLDEQALSSTWGHAVYGERLFLLDSVQQACDGQLSVMVFGGPARVLPQGPFWTCALEPAWKLDAIHMMEYPTACAAAGQAPDYPAARTAMPPDPSFESPLDYVSAALSTTLLPSFDRALQLHYRLLGSRRMAAAALAMRLYELDHGERPDTLTALVPDYLPAVPVDPFAEDGRTIGYRPHDAQPVLYSVGANGIDDEGRYDLRTDGSVDWDAKDIPFFLNGDRPRANRSSPIQPPASTQAADHDNDVQADDGQDEHGQKPQRAE